MDNNIWQEIKEKLKAKEVVAHYLGPPDKESGNNSFWCSPFREGDNDPSLSVKDNYIKDFRRRFWRRYFSVFSGIKKYFKKRGIRNFD